MNRAIVLNVNLDAGLFDDAADDLAARSNDVADLIQRNLHRVDARSVRRHIAARFGEHFIHRVDDVQTAPARLFKRFFHQRRGDVRRP